MAILIQTICLMLFLGMVYNWPFQLISERHIPITYVRTSFEEDSTSSSSLFNEINKMMAAMHERFQHMFNWPSFPMYFDDNDYDLRDYEDNLNLIGDLMDNEKKLNVVDDLTDIEKKFDAIEPVCTTITDSPTTISPRKSRRKKLPTTQTTTCIKELIINGQKHFSEEINTTDDKGVLIKQSKNSGIISIDRDQNKQ